MFGAGVVGSFGFGRGDGLSASPDFAGSICGLFPKAICDCDSW